MTNHSDGKPNSATWGDMLVRPDGWTDPRRQLRAYDLSNVRRYKSSKGFEYWVDIPKERISTSLSDTYLQFHFCSGIDYIGHSYATLHFDGAFVTILRSGPTPEHIWFDADFSERDANGVQVWHIDEIFRVLDLPDCESYPWVKIPSLLPRVEVKGISSFKNREQQEMFIYLCETLLSCYDGTTLDVRAGKITKGRVVWSKDITEKFLVGAYIK